MVRALAAKSSSNYEGLLDSMKTMSHWHQITSSIVILHFQLHILQELRSCCHLSTLVGNLSTGLSMCAWKLIYWQLYTSLCNFCKLTKVLILKTRNLGLFKSTSTCFLFKLCCTKFLIIITLKYNYRLALQLNDNVALYLR